MIQILVLVVVVALAGMCVYLVIRIRAMEVAFGRFFQSQDTPESIMQTLNRYADQEHEQNKRLKTLETHARDIQTLAEHAHTRIGFVRFNPFADTGGDQSFCLAVLDYKGNGWVLSSIHARTGSRVYAKQILLGQSSHNLSDEESTAVTKALKQNPYKHAAE